MGLDFLLIICNKCNFVKLVDDFDLYFLRKKFFYFFSFKIKESFNDMILKFKIILNLYLLSLKL